MTRCVARGGARRGNGRAVPVAAAAAWLPGTVSSRLPPAVAPRARLRGLPSMTSSAWLPRLPPIETLCANAALVHITATATATTSALISVAEVVEL